MPSGEKTGGVGVYKGHSEGQVRVVLDDIRQVGHRLVAFVHRGTEGIRCRCICRIDSVDGRLPAVRRAHSV